MDCGRSGGFRIGSQAGPRLRGEADGIGAAVLWRDEHGLGRRRDGRADGGGLAEDAEERQRVAAVRQAFESRTEGLEAEWRASDESGPTAIGVIGRAFDMIVMPQPGSLPKMPESVFETALFD